MLAELLIGSTLIGIGLFALKKLQQTGDGRGPGQHPGPSQHGAKETGALGVGDVLLHYGEEYWLSGCLSLNDGRFVLNLFSVPGAGAPRFLAQLDRAGEDLAILESVSLPSGPMPKEVRREGIVYRLHRAGTAAVSKEGDAPVSSDKAEFAIYRTHQEKLLLAFDFENGDRLSVLGSRFHRDTCEVLPGTAAGPG